MRLVLRDPGAVPIRIYPVQGEFRVVLAGSRSWSWCGSRSWAGAAGDRAVISGGGEPSASVRLVLRDPGAVPIRIYPVQGEFRVVLAGTAVASDWAALTGGLQCATFRTLLADPVAVLVPVVVVLEFRVVLAGSRRSWSWCESRSWSWDRGTEVACDWAALADGLQSATFRTLLADPVAVLFLVVVVLEIRVVLAGTRTVVACDWAALADGLQCATFMTLLGDPVAVLPPLVVVLEFRVVLATQHSSGRKAHQQQ